MIRHVSAKSMKSHEVKLYWLEVAGVNATTMTPFSLARITNGYYLSIRKHDGMLGVKPCDEPAFRLRRIRNPPGRFMPRNRDKLRQDGFIDRG